MGSDGVNSKAGAKGLVRHGAVLSFTAIVIVVYLITLRNPRSQEILTPLNNNLHHFIVQYGLIGAFFNSFIANASLIIQIPYPPLFIFLASQTDSTSYLLSLILIGGFGSALGEIISFYLGRTISQSLPVKPEWIEKIKSISHKRPQWTLFFVFIGALTPLPDDAFVIPLGIANYSVKKLFLAVLLGKTLYIGSLVYLTRLTLINIPEEYEAILFNPTSLFIVVLVFVIFIVYQFKQVNFSEVMMRFRLR